MSRRSSFCEKMGGVAPVAIGTRGTVGSLLMKEIDYFNMLEVERRHAGSQRISGDSSRKQSFWVLTLSWKRKKRRANDGILPNKLYSPLEVSRSNRFNGIPGFSYRILKDDVDRLFPV